jgi:purine-binding chemotaxis protein CheW
MKEKKTENKRKFRNRHINEKDLSVVEEELEEFVTFVIDSDLFGVDIHKVRDIIGINYITPVPRSPYFIKGVINLRGNIVPVVDLRQKFRLSEKEYYNNTVIIVVEVRDRFIGMIVDAVSDVVEIDVQSIHDSPHYVANIKEDFIKSIGRKDDKLIIILDVDRILSVSELEARKAS